MIALGIRYLCGHAAATDLARQKPEWPVHPGRVFLAMAAAHYETGAYPAERAALEWLEGAGPPEIRAGTGEARSYVRAYVPVNDEHGNIVQRSRQERAFPKVWLENDSVYLVWSSDPPESVRVALAQLCPKVTRIGHSSSLAQMWVVAAGQEPEPNWILSNNGKERFRIASGGTMAALDAAFNEEGFRLFDELNSRLRTATGRAKATLKEQIAAKFPGGQPEYRRPELAIWQGYEEGGMPEDIAPVEGPFDSNILVLAKFEGRNLGLDATLTLTKALRNAALRAATESHRRAPEWLSGHKPDGSPSSKPHVAFFPLAFTGSERADGHLMGLGIAVPREIGSETGESREETLRRVLGPLFFDVGQGEERKIRLWSNKPDAYLPEMVWEWKLERESRELPPGTLRAETWTRASRTWASVTPVVLHHYPKKSRPEDVELIVREAFLSALMPEPEQVLIRSASALAGAGHARSMPAFDEGGAGMCRYQTHVLVRFGTRVRGPVLVGRGRYRGYGFFKPVAEGKDHADGN